MSSNNDLGTLSVGLSLETAGLVAGLAGARDMLGGFAGVAASALGGIGVAMTKLAGNFEQANTLLVTSAGESQKNLGMVSAGIQQTAVDTATSTQSLQAAMFTIESSGQHGKAALLELTAAAQGARVENADLTGVVQALTTTMHDWREPASQAVDVMNSFREAASIGVMRMDDFTGAMKNVGPVASLLKIPLTDIEAALSTMSLEGDKGAAAGTHLAQSLMNMLHPSSAAIGVLQEIGLTSQQVSDDMQKSLPDTLALITESLAKKFPEGSAAYNAALATMFGGTRGLKSILELTGENLKGFEKDAAAIAPTMQANAAAVDGWALVQQNFNFKMDQAKERVEVLGIKVGTVLLPLAGQLLGAVTPLVQGFSDWATKGDNLQGVLSTIGGVIKSDVVDPALKLWKAVDPIVQDFERWNDKTHFLQNTLSDVGGFINTVAGYVANNLIPPVRSLIGHLEDWLTKSNFVHDALGALGTAVGIVSTVAGTLVGWVSGLVGWLTDGSPPAKVFEGLLWGIGAAIAAIKIEEFALGLGKAVTAIGGLGNILPAIVTKLLPNFAESIGLVGTTAGPAATQLALFTTAEATAGTATTGLGTVLAGLTGPLGIATAALAAFGTQVSPILTSWAQGITAANGTVANLHDKFMAEINDMKDKSPAAMATMADRILANLERLGTMSHEDAAKMAHDWVYGPDSLPVTADQVASRVTLILGGLVDESDTWGNGIGSQVAAGIMNQIGTISKASDHAAGEVKAYLQGLTEDAWGWGNDSGSQFAAGLYASAAKISSAADHAAGEVRAFLQFSLPEKGPLAHFDESMPHMGDMMSEGILAQRGKVGLAASALAQTFAQAVSASPSAGFDGSVHGAVPLPQTMPMLNGALPYVGSGGGIGGGPIVIEHHTHVELDSREIGHAVSRNHIAVNALGNAIVSHMRLRTGMRV